MKKATVTRWAVALGSVVGAFFALIAALHTPLGRPLRGVLALLPGCPVSMELADPARVEAFRLEQLRKHRGSEKAKAFVAGAFELGMPRERVDAWLESHGAACQEKRSASVIACDTVDSGDAGQMRALHLQFDERSRLVAVDFFRAGTCGAAAVAQLTRAEAALEKAVGPVTARRGQRSASFLDGGIYRRTSAEFRYADYLAELSAMSDRTGRVRVRETYQWLPKEAS